GAYVRSSWARSLRTGGRAPGGARRSELHAGVSIGSRPAELGGSGRRALILGVDGHDAFDEQMVGYPDRLAAARVEQRAGAVDPGDAPSDVAEADLLADAVVMPEIAPRAEGPRHL